ncbi:hypothetical protein ARMSODRAFT_983554 [Armillaria solidipes]|uniref:Uncharacterized protein n=1 Tax=Armillaria solidipes TaxID=1076256 RepID=A0A2H3AM46_9AGAR|nr:hypothetical protein ARMSODRAFT_983554 [Armillaria solidipes]
MNHEWALPHMKVVGQFEAFQLCMQADGDKIKIDLIKYQEHKGPSPQIFTVIGFLPSKKMNKDLELDLASGFGHASGWNTQQFTRKVDTFSMLLASETGSRTEPMVKGGGGTTVVVEGSPGNCGMIVMIVQKIPKSTGVVPPTVARGPTPDLVVVIC